MKKRLAIVVLGTAALISTACGGDGDGDSDSASKAGAVDDAKGGSINVWIMEPGAPDLKTFLTDASKAFEAANPGAKVKVTFKPWASAHDQFVTAIGGNQVPDVAEMGSTWTPEFGALGALTPAAGKLDGYVESLVEGATVDGVAYGLPWYAGARALIYRQDILEELRLEVPTTWEELLTVGRAIRDQKQMSAFSVAGNANHYFLPMVWQQGGEIATEQAGKWTSGMASKEAAEAIQFYADLYSKEKFAPGGALTWNARDVRAAFEAGDLAMMIGGGWDVQAILKAHPELDGKIGTALLPKGPGGSRDTFAGGSHLVVFDGSKHEALAQKYVKFMLEPARVTAFADQIGFLPGSLGALGSITPPLLYQTFTEQLKEHSRTYPPTTAWGGFEADGLFVNAVQQVMKGDKTAAQALKGVAEAMDAEFGDG